MNKASLKGALKRMARECKRKGTKAGQARGAFGKPKGPFDINSALNPRQMRERYPNGI